MTIEENIKILKNKGLTFKNLYDYFYSIYLSGYYRNIDINYIDFNGSELIDINNNGSLDAHVSLYKVMNKGTRLEEQNCIRFFNYEGDYVDNATLEDVLNLFNSNFKNLLKASHVYEK